MSSRLKQAGKKRFDTREIVYLSFMAALMLAGQVAMAQLPNIEPVTLFIIVGTAVFGYKILLSVYVFAVAEALIYGIGMWTISYFYVWTILAVAAILLRNAEGRLLWAAVAGFFGLIFGLLCSIPYLAAGGIAAAIAWFVKGIPFDILHAVGNFAMVFFFKDPLVKLLKKLTKS